MKQIEQNYRSGRLRVAEVPAPNAGRGQLLVQSRFSLISTGTEKQLIDLAKASLAGKAMARPDLVRQVLRATRRDGIAATAQKVFSKLDTPIPLGYSLAGTVLEAGRGVAGFQVGDRVACAGAAQANHADFNAVPKNLCARIPDGVSDEQASFVTLGAIALQGVRQAQPTLGEKVVVMGLGLIGLLTVQLLKANGCRVLGFDPNPERAQLARDLGADMAVSDGLESATATFTDSYGADAVIVAASARSNEPLNTAGAISRMKGRVIVVGLVGMAMDRDIFYKRELDLRLSMSYGPGRHDPAYEQAGHDYPLPYVRWTEQRNMEAFLALVAEGRVTPEKLITHAFDIAEGEKAYALIEAKEPHLAIVLRYPETPDMQRSQPGPAPKAASKPAAGKAALGVGFIGLGNYGKSVLLPAVQKAGDVRLTGVVTSTGLSASNAGEKFGFGTIATDRAAVLEDGETDVVFVATRHDTHASLTEAALAGGKHVFCEKPLALSLEELDSVSAAARTAGQQLTVGFNRRFAPMTEQARAALAQRSGPLAMMVRINAGEIPQDSWIQRSEGGGRIIGEICHFVDTCISLTGAPVTEVHAISARGHDDTVTITLRFADGSTGTILYSSMGDAAVSKEYFEIFGAGVVVQLTDFTELKITRNGKTETHKGTQDKGQKAMVKRFLSRVREGGEAIIPLEELINVTEVTFAIEASLRSGAPVSLEEG